ncbi:MAG: MarR family transcriptional regulator [Rhodobacteraceae bacterium]|nr:MarR family transcriptional regulator [Paracoccaceae bacterium]
MSVAEDGDITGEAGPAFSQDDLLDLTGYNMKRAYMRIYADISEALAGFDLRQRSFSVLSLVVANPEIRQSDIARELGIERSGTVVIVDELEGRKLIRRADVPGDRRAHALTATRDGIALYRCALAEVDAREGHLMNGFTASERALLNALLRRIHELN